MALSNLSIEEKKDDKKMDKKANKEFNELNKVAQKLRNQDESYYITKWSESDLKKTEVEKAPGRNQKWHCGSKLRYKLCCEESDNMTNS